MVKLKRREKVKHIPSVVLVLAIDAIDLINFVTAPLVLALGLGLVLDVGFDFVQIMLANFFFENPALLFLGAFDLLLPPPLDLMPTFTGAWFVLEGF